MTPLAQFTERTKVSSEVVRQNACFEKRGRCFRLQVVPALRVDVLALSELDHCSLGGQMKERDRHDEIVLLEGTLRRLEVCAGKLVLRTWRHSPIVDVGLVRSRPELRTP